jgi:SAM-dependent methyltransferase
MSPARHSRSESGHQATWEEHYAAKPQVWSGRVNTQLAAIATQLSGGRALDVGCGEGGDAIWLAEHGWSVVGVDVSHTALARARAAAAEHGVAARIEFTHYDLTVSFPDDSFDLVSACFLHSTVEMDRPAILRRAAAAVAPGGALLIVDHAAAPPWATTLRDHPFPSLQDVVAGLKLQNFQWISNRMAAVNRPVSGPDGEPVTLVDNVIWLQRAAPPEPSGTQLDRPGLARPESIVYTTRVDQKAKPDIQQALTRRLKRQAAFNGTIVLPAAPGMLDEYVALCDETFKVAGVFFSSDELGHLRGVLGEQLAEAFKSTSRSEIAITYESKWGASTLEYRVVPRWVSIEDAYDNWVATREPPLFGTEPDARVWQLAGQASDPGQFPVLDIGAGTGRNSLALARRGHPVDAVEMSPRFAEIIRTEAQRDFLNVRVIEKDMSDARNELRGDYQLIVLSEVVSDFRTLDQVKEVFELAAQSLATGGHLVFNVFLEKAGYQPDAAARDLGQQMYTSIFTYAELAEAAAQLPLQLVADDSVYDYEQANLPAGAWPQTSWYVGWINGQDTFDLPREICPIEMRWLVYRKAW